MDHAVSVLRQSILDSAPALVSFDVFDTALTRRVLRPADVFTAVGRRLLDVGCITCSPESFQAARVSAELEERRARGDQEIKLPAIYQRLATRYHWTAETAEQAAAVEVDSEKSLMVAIEPVRALYHELRRRGVRVIFISDMYLSHETVHQLLLVSGYHDVSPEDVYVSSRIGKTKRKGDLFRWVLEQEAISAAELIHVGDHPKSDVTVPRRMGIQAIHLDIAAPTRYENVSLNGDKLLAGVIGGSARVSRLSLMAPLQHKHRVWDIACNVAGPLIFAFSHWVLRRAQEQGIRRLYFLARDGFIIRQVAQLIAEQESLGIECRYLLASRRALYLPSADLDSSMLKSWLLVRNTAQSMGDVVDRLCLSDSERSALATLLEVDQAFWSAEPNQKNLDKLKHVLGNPAFQDLLHKKAAEAREALQQYLEAEGMFDGTPCGLVDVGWYGRLQAALELIVTHTKGQSAPRLSGFYMGLLHSEKVKHAGPVQALFKPEILLNQCLVELWTSATHGTLRGFQFDKQGHVVPELGPTDHGAIDWGLEVLHEGILRYAKEMLHTWKVLNLDASTFESMLQQHAIDSMLSITQTPSRTESECLGDYLFASDEAHSNSVRVARPLSLAEVLRLYKERAGIVDFTYWPEGSIRRSIRPDAAGNLMLQLWSASLKAKRAIKKLRNRA